MNKAVEFTWPKEGLRVGFLLPFLCLLFGLACAPAPSTANSSSVGTPIVAVKPNPPQNSLTSSVIRLVKPGKIHADDRSLDDWDGIKPIQSLACANQWRAFECKEASPPSPCRPDQVDLEGSVYLVWDGSNLYFAVDVVDDVVLSVPSIDSTDDKHPWIVDAAELFFAAECESQGDYHDCVQLDKPVFQLLLCPSELQDKKYHLAEYRTPGSVISKALQTVGKPNGFQATGWKTKNGWQAEAVFPLAALENVKGNTWSGKKMKVSFDILDYDRKPARWEEPCWGFEPDHVISNVREQKMVSIPALMSEFIFEAKK